MLASHNGDYILRLVPPAFSVFESACGLLAHFTAAARVRVENMHFSLIEELVPVTKLK